MCGDETRVHIHTIHTVVNRHQFCMKLFSTSVRYKKLFFRDMICLVYGCVG